jgi:c-di-GMP-binding flagellar brake protein YcgR
MVAEKGANQTKVISGFEKRYLPRWKVANRVVYQLENEDKTYESNSCDISCNGASFVSAQRLPVNGKIKLKIFLSSDNVVSVEGQVVWSKPAEKLNLSGIMFANTSQKAQELILKYAFEIRKEDMVKYWFQGWNTK